MTPAARLSGLPAAALAALAVLVPALAAAHPGHGLAAPAGAGGGFLDGFTHPLFGWDHVVAMVAVGLWGAFLGAPALWLLPVVFPLVMAGGAALGILGVPLPFVEVGIAASALVLGLLVLMQVRLALPAAVAVVGVFAVFHGHAHGTELPGAANAFAYGAGFVLATGLLHLAGVGFGLLVRWPVGVRAVQAGGGAIAAAGLAFLLGVV